MDNSTNITAQLNSLVLTPVPIETILMAVRKIVQEELKADTSKTLDEKLLSPAEVCKMFNPPISKVTLTAWTKKDLLQEHRLGGRIFYKQSEIIEGLRTLKKYKTN